MEYSQGRQSNNVTYADNSNVMRDNLNAIFRTPIGGIGKALRALEKPKITPEFFPYDPNNGIAVGPSDIQATLAPADLEILKLLRGQ